MNACCITEDGNKDTLARFFDDTVQSAREFANLELIHTLVTESSPALTWFRDRVGVVPSVLVQLGGYSCDLEESELVFGILE
jgi:succinate dehydrogenase/fumarate reductase flavoprotein subunit